MSQYLDYNYLRSIPGASIANFGLGFIQLKLPNGSRVHFWTGEPMVDEDEIHDHRYTFHSNVLKGMVTHETFDFIESKRFMAAPGPMTMRFVSCDPNNPIAEDDAYKALNGDIVGTGLYYLKAGSHYTFNEGQFHRSFAQRGTVTYLDREPTVRKYARVISTTGKPMVCPFSDPREPEALWADVKAMLEAPDPETQNIFPGYHLAKIPRGVLGEVSKIVEETAELVDADAQGAKIMILHELSDLYGSIEAYLNQHHPSFTMADLQKMASLTNRAFVNGQRR